jgi:hypothetical protein
MPKYITINKNKTINLLWNTSFRFSFIFRYFKCPIYSRSICVTNDNGYIPFVVITTRSFPHSLLNTVFMTRVTRRVSLMELELFTLPEHKSISGFSGVPVVPVFCYCFVDRCLSLFCWSLYCLSFLDLRLLITPLLSSNARALYCLSLDLRLLITPVISFGHCIVCPS